MRTKTTGDPVMRGTGTVRRARSERKVGLTAAACLASVALLVPAVASGAGKPQVLFDDFSYTSFHPLLDLWQHGWKIRTTPGWPGMAGATWSAAAISFVRDP